MKPTKLSMILGSLLFLALVASSRITAAEGPVTIHGYVLDSACAFTKHLKKPVSPACAVACAKGGSPLMILGDDGQLYLPISDSTPARSQNPRLMKYAGKRVTVTGTVYEEGGAPGLVIQHIEAASSE